MRKNAPIGATVHDHDDPIRGARLAAPLLPVHHAVDAATLHGHIPLAVGDLTLPHLVTPVIVVAVEVAAVPPVPTHTVAVADVMVAIDVVITIDAPRPLVALPALHLIPAARTPAPLADRGAGAVGVTHAAVVDADPLIVLTRLVAAIAHLGGLGRGTPQEHHPQRFVEGRWNQGGPPAVVPL